MHLLLGCGPGGSPPPTPTSRAVPGPARGAPRGCECRSLCPRAAPLTSAARPERGADRPGRHPLRQVSRSPVRSGCHTSGHTLADQNPPALLWKPGLGSNVARLDEQFDSRPRCSRNVGLGCWTKVQVPTQEPLRADGCRIRCQADHGSDSLPGRVTFGGQVLHRVVRALRSLSPGLRVRSRGLDETPACLPTRRPRGHGASVHGWACSRCVSLCTSPCPAGGGQSPAPVQWAHPPRRGGAASPGRHWLPTLGTVAVDVTTISPTSQPVLQVGVGGVSWDSGLRPQHRVRPSRLTSDQCV